MTWLAILAYREFHDVPRMLVVAIGARVLLLDSPFDDIADDYSPDYRVYELGPNAPWSTQGDWRLLAAGGTQVGRMPVARVEFDATRRKAICARSLAEATSDAPGR